MPTGFETLNRFLERVDIFPESFIVEMNAVSAGHTGVTREELLAAVRTQLDGIEKSWQSANSIEADRML